ncbi:MAG: pyridoxal-phosphate dependent enzyme [Chitinivibrionales bacterium]|nr:pyridoxal-phosphate dependent enzyme [Chitinivibrionales bacterium]
MYSRSKLMSTIPLFRRYPALKESLPRIEMAALPTPVERVSGLTAGNGQAEVYVKRDDLTGDTFGGNKIRKLEFLLGQARAEGRTRVITVGGAGSNHALATTLCARQVGLRAALMLFPQPNAHAVRRNLLMDLHAGADLHPCDDYGAFRDRSEQLRAHYSRLDGVEPMLIPAGGSAPAGVVGYVNAGLELAEQIRAGVMPRPSRIYLALGTMGTAVGLLMGLRVAGFEIEVVGVRVVPTSIGSESRMRSLFDATNRLLHEKDASFPLLEPHDDWFRVEHGFYGGEYGRFTAESVDAVTRVGDATGLALDGTYTGKACAALLAHMASGQATGPLLYWHTRNSRPYPPEALARDYHELPRELWPYFENPVQEETFG